MIQKEFTATQELTWALVGFLVFVGVWWALAEAISTKVPVVDYDTRLPSELDSTAVQIDRDSLALADSALFANATEFRKSYPILPPPLLVVKALPKLFLSENLAGNTWNSVWRNLQGYFWAILISLPLGFLLGLFPVVRAMFSKEVDALRYLPLTALIGLFLSALGVGEDMKVAFLAFGILVYLIPVVVQRINEVERVHLQTAYTLGASNWQMLRTVYFPSVFSKLLDDLRVLTAISWTYIIIAESYNREGGVGSMIFLKGKQGQTASVYAILLVIILVGFLQDRIFVYFGRRLFPHKFYKSALPGLREIKYGVYAIFAAIVVAILGAWLAGGSLSLVNQMALVLFFAGIAWIIINEIKVYSHVRNAK